MHYIDGKMIRSLREGLGMTQAALADKLNVTDKTISKWETGRGLPDIHILTELAEQLHVSVVELLAGESVENRNVSANMRKTVFYVCPVCGNIIPSVGEAVVFCHGIQLPVLEAEALGDEMQVELIENEYVVTVNSPMKKNDYISFLAYVSSDSVQLTKQYPEQEARARFMRKGHGRLYAYDTRKGLGYKNI